MLSIRFSQGEKRVIPGTISDDDGDPFDLSQYDVHFLAKRGDKTIEKSDVGGGIVLADLGEVEIHFDAEDTDISAGKYEIEIWLEGADEIIEVDKGQMVISTSVWSEVQANG